MRRYDYNDVLAELAELERGWDSYGADPIDAGVLKAVDVFLLALFTGDASIVPTTRGGVQLEVHRDGITVEVEFDCENAIAGFHGAIA